MLIVVAPYNFGFVVYLPNWIWFKAKIILKTTSQAHSMRTQNRCQKCGKIELKLNGNIYKIRNLKLNIEHGKLLNKQPFNLINPSDICMKHTITIGSNPSKVDLLNKQKNQIKSKHLSVFEWKQHRGKI